MGARFLKKRGLTLFAGSKELIQSAMEVVPPLCRMQGIEPIEKKEEERWLKLLLASSKQMSVLWLAM